MSLINQICRQITDVQFPIEVEKLITDWIYTRINKSKMLRDFAGSDLLSKAREDYNDSCGMLDNILKKPMPYIRDWYYETIHNESQKGNYFTDYGNLGPTMHYFDITIPVGEGSGENGRMLKEDVIKFIRYSPLHSWQQGFSGPPVCASASAQFWREALSVLLTHALWLAVLPSVLRRWARPAGFAASSAAGRRANLGWPRCSCGPHRPRSQPWPLRIGAESRTPRAAACRHRSRTCASAWAAP